MGINSIESYDKNKVRRFGKYFETIDFEFRDKMGIEEINRNKASTMIGNFKIGKYSFSVTLAELEQIRETANNALSVFEKSYVMGRYGK